MWSKERQMKLVLIRQNLKIQDGSTETKSKQFFKRILQAEVMACGFLHREPSHTIFWKVGHLNINRGGGSRVPVGKHQSPISWLCLPPKSAFAIIIPRLLFKCRISALAVYCEECLVTCSTHKREQKFLANPWNMLDASADFPASVSADSLLMVSRAMKPGPA